MTLGILKFGVFMIRKSVRVTDLADIKCVILELSQLKFYKKGDLLLQLCIYFNKYLLSKQGKNGSLRLDLSDLPDLVELLIREKLNFIACSSVFK